MSVENSLKRNSQELGPPTIEEVSSEPHAKISKTDSEPNLKNNVTDEILQNVSTDLIIIEETSIEENSTVIEVPPEGNITSIKENSTLIEVASETNITSIKEDSTVIEVPSEANRSSIKESSTIIGVPSEVSITIKFHDKSISEQYKPKFLKFLSSFMEFQTESQEDCIEVYRNQSITIDQCTEVESTETCTNDSSPSKRRKKRSRVKKELFVVDATPSSQTPQIDLRYTTKFTISTEKNEENTEKPSRQTCFNCGEFHALKDCTQPRDHNRINAARQRFKQQPKSSRYHLEEDQKYSHLKPGVISNELRKALGLHKHEAPHFIYMMRQLGYPPGWLEEAKFVHSNLDMFDIDGKFVKTTGAKKQGLDPEKVVDYPGFNVPFEKGIKDEFRKYEVPPYSDNFSKEAMMKFYNEKFAKEEDNLETCDMDIDHEQEGLNNSKEEIKRETMPESRDSPSLVDLEQQKQQLLEELNDQVKDTSKDFLAVKTTCFGTPILKSSSPYMTLPHPDNFSKDVSPVINFENLPNSTGKYEQMTDVLQKVRSELKKIQNCNV